MEVKLERLETNIAKLEIKVSAADFNNAIQKAYRKNSNKINIQGFRKGKAPLQMIEKIYGESVFFEDAIEIICDETYPQAVKDNDLSPVDYPEIEVVQVGKDVEFIYNAKVTLRPEVKLCDVKAIEVEKVVYEVTDKDIEEHLNSIREKNARVMNVEEGTVNNGDVAVIDFEGFLEGVPFEGGKGEAYPLTIGSGSFIPGFEEQLVGVKVGETVDVNTTFPEDYHAENLKGKDVLFKVKVNSIRVKELPEMDDEFAKDVSEFDTLEELKADVRKKQEETNKVREKNDFEEAALNAVVDASEVEIPEVMVNREIEYMIMDLDYRLKQQGLTVEKYTELMGVSIDKVKEDFKEVAKGRVKTNMILLELSKIEKIDATDEEVEARADELSKYYGSENPEKIKQTILKSQRDMIKEELVNNKVLAHVVATVKAK